jgi:phosphoserine phosphatase
MQPDGPPAPVPAAPVLAVDLDGTYCRVNTFPLFVRFLLRTLPRRGDVVALASLVTALFRRKVLRHSHLVLKAAVHRAGERVPPQDVRAWAAEVLRDTGNPAVAELVRDWAGGTVLATSAPGVYADVLGELAGFDLVHASGYEAGVYVENVHAAKADRLQRTLSGPPACAVSDDTVVDGPLLALAATALLVTPDGRVTELGRS